MKFLFPAILSLSVTLGASQAAPRQLTIEDIPDARESLSRIVSPNFYKSMLISPVEGWIAVRGQLAGDHLIGPRIIRSDLGGEYDAVALELAGNLKVLSNRSLGPEGTPRSVLLEVLVYPIADGNLLVSFAHFDEPGGGQIRYYGSAWMSVEKANHLWVTINPNWIALRAPRAAILHFGRKRARPRQDRDVARCRILNVSVALIC